MNPSITSALIHSPKHKNAIIVALAQIADTDITGAATVVKRKCEELRIADFPNPFPHGSDDRAEWDSVWHPAEAEDPAFELIDYDAMSKNEIAQLVKKRMNVNIATWSTKPAVIARAKSLLSQAAQQ